MNASAAVYLDRYRVQTSVYVAIKHLPMSYVLCAHRHTFAVCVFDCPSHGHASVNNSARYYWLPCALLQACFHDDYGDDDEVMMKSMR